MSPCIIATISIIKNLQKAVWIFFQKFIRFGSGILPLKPLHCKNVNFTGNFNSVAWGAIVFEQNIQAELGAMIPS